MAYLVDTDIFIAAKNLHYGMDFCPAFWDWLTRANAAGRLMSIEAVRNDLAAGEDELAVWAKALDGRFFVPPAPTDLRALGLVTQWGPLNNRLGFCPIQKTARPGRAYGDGPGDDARAAR